MSMKKKLADDAIKWLNERMESHTDSRCASEGEVYMAAMSCRIQELERTLLSLIEDSDVRFTIGSDEVKEVEAIMGITT
tara:strand:- start:4965 stop:5201 length:237 start_codon:yes stop_codon:yes gene_type:complete